MDIRRKYGHKVNKYGNQKKRWTSDPTKMKIRLTDGYHMNIDENQMNKVGRIRKSD